MAPSFSGPLLVQGNEWPETTLVNNQPPTDLPKLYASWPEVPIWRNWPPNQGGYNYLKGEVWSPPFAPPPVVAVPIGGASYPGSSNRVFFECTTDGRQLPVSHLELLSMRSLVLVDLGGFCPGPVRLGAVSEGKSLLIVGTPSAVSHSEAIALRYLAPLLGALLAATITFLLWLAATLLAAKATNGTRAVTIGLLLTAIIAMAVFWAFSLSGPTGSGAAAIAITGAAALTIHTALYRRAELWATASRIAAPCLAWLVFGFLALALWGSIDNGGGQTAANTTFFPIVLSTDNHLPTMIAHALAEWTPVSKINLGSWLISDRPPLLIGYLLLIDGLILHTVPDHLGFSVPMIEQAAGIIFMALWLPAAWLGLRLAGIRERQILLLLGTAAFSGFCLLNTVYIWPKLLGGGFGLMMILSLVGLINRSGPPTFLLSVAAIAGALSLLCHTGVFFGVLATLIVFTPTIMRQGVRPLLISAALGAATLGSWVIWQNLYQPGGYALARFALTGDFGMQRRDVSLVTDAIAAYSRLTLDTYLQMKTDALLTLVGLRVGGCAVKFPQSGLGILRFHEFYHLAYVIAIPSLAAVTCMIFRSPGGAPTAMATRLLLVALVTTIIWFVLTWDCHIVHHFSYQAVLAGLIGFWATAFATNRKLALPFAGCSVLLEGAVWIVDPLDQALSVRWPWLLILALLLALSARQVIRAACVVDHGNRKVSLQPPHSLSNNASA